MNSVWIDEEGNEGEAISSGRLAEEGVLNQRLSTDPAQYQEPLDHLKKEQGYVEQDEIGLKPDTEGLSELLAKFKDEHLHTEDEVRFVLEGAGVFEIRSRDDKWMRVTVEAGDLIVVPADRYHRFRLTETNTIRCVRLFQDKAGWVPHYR